MLPLSHYQRGVAAVTPKISEHLQYFFFFFANNMRAFQVYVNSLQMESFADDFSREVFKLKLNISINEANKGVGYISYKVIGSLVKSQGQKIGYIPIEYELSL